MRRVDPTSVVESHQLLTSIFGHWPSFHDAEVVELSLWRGDVKPDAGKYIFPVLTAKLILAEIVPRAEDETKLDLLPRARVTLRFRDVDDLNLQGFNHCNQIVGLWFALQDRGTFTDGTPLPPYVLVEFERGFGISASFKCFGVEVVEATPWVSDAA